jgi:hypothetical protein
MEVFSPTFHQMYLLLSDESAYSVEFFTTEAAAPLQVYGVQPEFRCIIVALDVDVRRLISVTRVEEKAVRSPA